MKSLKNLFMVALFAVISAFVIIKFCGCPGVSLSSSKEEHVDLSELRLKDEQKITVASVNARANGVVGETHVIHSIFFGEEHHDTVPLSEFSPSARFLKFDNVSVKTELGIDTKSDSGIVFNEGSYGIWNSDRSVFSIHTTPKKMSVLSVYAQGATERSDSYFTGKISEELYQSTLLEKVGIPSLVLFESSPQYSNYCYAKAVKVFAKQFLSLSEKQRFEVVVLINDIDYSRIPTEQVSLGCVDISTTVVR